MYSMYMPAAPINLLCRINEYYHTLSYVSNFQILFDSEEELGTDLEAAQGRDEDDSSDNEMLVTTIPADLSAIPWAQQFGALKMVCSLSVIKASFRHVF